MAIYRQIQIAFWQDELIIELEPDEKYFYLYLMTNDKTTQCGVYRINKKIVEFDTGFPIEKINKLIMTFINNKRIKYNEDNNEIFLVNWLKFNKAASPKVAVVIDRELNNVKTPEFHNEVIKRCNQYGYPIKTKEIQYGYPIDTASNQDRYPIDTETQPEPEPAYNQNNNQNQQQTANNNVHNKKSSHLELPPAPAADVSQTIDFYQNNFGMLNPYTAQQIIMWEQDLSTELVLEAMQRAILNNKNFGYAVGIMKDWAKKNIKTIEEVNVNDVRFERQKQQYTPQAASSGVPADYDYRKELYGEE